MKACLEEGIAHATGDLNLSTQDLSEPSREVDLKPRQRGSAKGTLVIHSEDDEHLADFNEHMP